MRSRTHYAWTHLSSATVKGISLCNYPSTVDDYLRCSSACRTQARGMRHVLPTPNSECPLYTLKNQSSDKATPTTLAVAEQETKTGQRPTNVHHGSVASFRRGIAPLRCLFDLFFSPPPAAPRFPCSCPLLLAPAVESCPFVLMLTSPCCELVTRLCVSAGTGHADSSLPNLESILRLARHPSFVLVLLPAHKSEFIYFSCPL